ncbi:MAG TPA: hypothetical protein VHS05_26310 [Pyrinomonadaceae bacterium]|nr:hypothetical protein [Pyrinomonadaceae bacterium]
MLLLDALEGTSDKYEKGKSHLDGARILYQSFIQDGLLTDELISAALRLAHLEGTRRSDAFNEANLVRLDEKDVADLRRLMSLCGSRIFPREELVILIQHSVSTRSNADLIIDDNFIDIKTTKHLVLDRRHLHQLVQYYTLLSLEGIDVGQKRPLNYFEEECEVGLKNSGFESPLGTILLQVSLANLHTFKISAQIVSTSVTLCATQTR